MIIFKIIGLVLFVLSVFTVLFINLNPQFGSNPSFSQKRLYSSFENYVDGNGGEALHMPAGGSLRPASSETVKQRLHYVKQDGKAVFKFAVRNTEQACRRLLERNGFLPDDVDLFVSHQANIRIIQSAAEKLGLQSEKVIINIQHYGNTTAGTIPLALNEAMESGRLKRGDLVLLASVGAGFTVGAVLLRWGLND